MYIRQWRATDKGLDFPWASLFTTNLGLRSLVLLDVARCVQSFRISERGFRCSCSSLSTRSLHGACTVVHATSPLLFFSIAYYTRKVLLHYSTNVEEIGPMIRGSTQLTDVTLNHKFQKIMEWVPQEKRVEISPSLQVLYIYIYIYIYNYIYIYI